MEKAKNMSTVKNNEQTAATDQQKVETAKRIATINIVSSLVAKNNIDIDTIPNLFRRVDGLFEAGMYATTSLELPAPVATQTAIPAPAQPIAVQQPAPVAAAAPVKMARRSKAQQSAATVAEASAPVVEAAAGKKRGRKAASTTVAEAAPVQAPAVEAPVAEAPRPRGRPRKLEEKLVMGQFAVPYDAELSQEENDARFLAKYPPIMSVEESLQPVGERGQMRLIFSQKPVSFVKTQLGRYYGRTFEDYKRIYNLPADYPEKPPAYVEKMQTIAAAAGLGTTLPKVKKVEDEQQVEAKTAAPKAPRKPKATPQRKAEEAVAEAQPEAPKAAPGERKRKTRNIEAQAA
jgi:predicted transcriptional regulator